MVEMGMRELKENMGRFVSLLQGGQRIVLTLRGRPFGVVRHAGRTRRTSRERRFLDRLVGEGLIAAGTGQIRQGVLPLDARGRPVSEIVIHSRE